MAHLVACRDGRIHRIRTLGWAPLLVGASVAPPHLMLPGRGVAPTHLRILRDGDGVRVLNLAGTGALRVGGRATEGRGLVHGDRLEIGDWEITYLESDETAEEPDEGRERDLLESWFRMERELGAAVEPGDLLERMLDALLQVFRAERGFILLGDGSAEEEDFRPALVRHMTEADCGHGVSRTVVEQIRRERRPLAVGDAEQRFAGAPSLEAAHIRSIIAAPLETPAGELLGLLYMDGRAEGRFYGERDLALLEAFALHGARALELALERQQLRRSNSRLRALHHVDRREKEAGGLVGTSAAMAELRASIARLAPERVTTLILGESGTGKELVARAIHQEGPWRDGPFVAVHCMALSPQVVESELFGHEKGAFTGAEERRIGRFELAHGGTLFLDEVGELSPEIQVKLLRVLQEREFERVGSAETIPVDVRVVAATNADLKRACVEGRFREDLFYRLSVFTLDLPPLRRRGGDVRLLAESFAHELARARGRSFPGFDGAAMAALEAYPWPGNVRELRNVIERAMVLSRDGRVTSDCLPADLTGRSETGGPGGGVELGGLPRALAEARECFEKSFVLDTLRRHEGNVASAARDLAIPRSTIYRKCKVWGIDPKTVD